MFGFCFISGPHLHGKDDIIKQITDQCFQYYPSIDDTNYASTSDVEVVQSAKRMKGSQLYYNTVLKTIMHILWYL